MAQRRSVKYVQDERHVEFRKRSPESYDGFNKGDLVKIENERGIFSFVYASLDEDGVATSFTVYGGLKGRAKMRTFVPERVSHDKARARLRKKTEES